MVFEIQYFDSSAKQRYEIKGNKCVIGRSKNTDLQIDRDGMSRKHLEVEWDGKEFYVTDLNSTNGVYVNSERIPAGARTLYKNFLPLEIADKITIFVYSDEQVAAEEFKKEMDMPAASPMRESTTSSNASSSNTRTMRMERSSSTSSSGKKSSQEKKKASSPLMPILLLAIGGGAYYHFTHTETASETATPAENGLEKKEKKKNPMLALDEDTLADNLRGTKCQGLVESALCHKLGKLEEKEGIVITDKQIIVTINTKNMLKKISSPTFIRFKPEERMEYMLADIATRPYLIEEAVKHKLSILVVGFNLGETRAKVTGALDFNPTNLPPLTEKDQRVLFNNIYNAGIYRPYKIFYKPMVAFKNFATEENAPAPDAPPQP